MNGSELRSGSVDFLAASSNAGSADKCREPVIESRVAGRPQRDLGGCVALLTCCPQLATAGSADKCAEPAIESRVAGRPHDSPALQRWVGWEIQPSPPGTTRFSLPHFHHGTRQLKTIGDYPVDTGYIKPHNLPDGSHPDRAEASGDGCATVSRGPRETVVGFAKQCRSHYPRTLFSGYK